MVTREEIQTAIDNEQAMGAWTEKLSNRKIVRPTAIAEETKSGFWIYGYVTKTRNSRRQTIHYPRRYFISKDPMSTF